MDDVPPMPSPGQRRRASEPARAQRQPAARKHRKGAGRRFYVTKKKKVRIQGQSSPEARACEDYDSETLGVTCKQLRRRLADVAKFDLWQTEYATLLAEETATLARMGVLQKSAELKVAAPISTYSLQKRRSDSNVEKSVRTHVDQMRESAALAVRQNNQQTYPFSICARSVAYMSNRTPTKQCALCAPHYIQRSM